MHGRSFGLLAILLMIGAAKPLAAQSVRFAPEPDFAGRVGHSLPASVRGPIFHLPAHISSDGFGIAQLTHTAGMIFTGTVTAISGNHSGGPQTLATVSISFHVENAIRGATPGDTLTITEWIGLWSSGQRYRIGERVLVFLYPPSKLGLTSCVRASFGRFEVDRAGRILLSGQQFSAFLKDPVLGGKSRLRFSDFALAVRQASEEEWPRTGGDHDH